jgi:prophage DNA circulation protein
MAKPQEGEITTMEERFTNNAINKIEPGMKKITNVPINALIGRAVPKNLRCIPEIKEELEKANTYIEQKQQDVIEKTSKKVASVGVKVATAIPFIGNGIAIGSAIDNAVAAGKEMFRGFGKIKNRIQDLRNKANSVKERIAAAAKKNSLGIRNFASTVKARAKSAIGLKGGGQRTRTRTITRTITKKNSTSTGDAILNRTQHTINHFHDPINSKYHHHTKKLPSQVHLKTRKLHADKILERTTRSVAAFHG